MSVKKALSKAAYWQITGLLALAHRERRTVDAIEEALCELTGEKKGGHCMDAIYSDYDVDTLLAKLQSVERRWTRVFSKRWNK